MGEHEGQRPEDQSEQAQQTPTDQEQEGSADGEQGASSAGGGGETDTSAEPPVDGAQHDEDRADHEDHADDEERAREEERQREEFAREHDPADHDVEAGADFRQPGDWSADEHGGPQVVESDGTVHSPDDEDGEAPHQSGQAASGDDSAGEGAESGSDEVRDGGHGWGSAAPLEDGRTPQGHPIKAWHDTMTFVQPGEDGYDAAPHVWFADAGAAEQAGFRHAHG